MALTKGTNSYVTASEADTYFSTRLDVAAWTAADVTEKEKALVTASGVLDGLIWTGVAVSELQPLAFPRRGSYFDPRIGLRAVLDGSTIPARVETATKELAYHLLNNDGILDDMGNVNDMSIGQINLSTIRAPNLVPSVVKRLIKPLLANAGQNSWWRAN
jgi:hypothetical protein